MRVSRYQSDQLIKILKSKDYTRYRNWVEIYNITRTIMPVGGEAAECIKIYCNTLVYMEETMGNYFSFPHHNDGYVVFDNWLVEQEREYKINEILNG